MRRARRRWLERARAEAAFRAAASGYSTVEQPRPEGTLREDQMSWVCSFLSKGGQLMTGRGVLADTTGPSPLLRPAMAMIATGYW